MKEMIWWHKNCADGLFAAATVIAARLRDGVDERNILHKPVQYGDITMGNVDEWADELDTLGIEQLWVVDFSLPQDVAYKIMERCDGLEIQWIDHHKTAFESWGYDLAESQQVNSFHKVGGSTLHTTLDNRQAGADLAWVTLFPDRPIPHAIKLVADRDLWKFEYGSESRHFNAGLYAQRDRYFDPHLWGRWLAEHQADPLDPDTLDLEMLNILDIGRVIHEQTMTEVHQFAMEATTIDFHGLKVAVVNAPPKYASELGSYLTDEENGQAVEAALIWSVGKDGVRCSLRSKGDVDVSAIAKKYGGGGHRNAAGFAVDGLTEFANLIRSNP